MTRRAAIVSTVLLGLALLAAPVQAAPSKALLYNATGDRHDINVDGRTHSLDPAQPVLVLQNTNREDFSLTMPNTEGQVLIRELQRDNVYVLLYKNSEEKYVIWGSELLNEMLHEALSRTSGSYKAVVFNATGKRVGVKEKDGRATWLDKAICLYHPSGSQPDDIRTEFRDLKVKTPARLENQGRYVLVYDQKTGHEFLKVDQWLKRLTDILAK